MSLVELIRDGWSTKMMPAGAKSSGAVSVASVLLWHESGHCVGYGATLVTPCCQER